MKQSGKTLKIFLIAALFTAAIFFCACGQNNGTAAKRVYINEVVSGNKLSLVDEHAGTPDWVELYNASGSDVNLTGYGLTDNLRKIKKFIFPEGIVLPAGGYLVVYCGENNDVTAMDVFCTGFGLAKSGDFLYLTDPYFNVVQEMQIPSLLTDVSYARRSNGTYGYTDKTTPGAANNDANIVDDINLLLANRNYNVLEISEVLPASSTEGPWAEIHNLSGDEVNLHNYYLSDVEGSPKKWRLPDVTIAPYGFRVVYMSGTQTGAHVLESSFRLGKKDTGLWLTAVDGSPVSSLAWDENVPGGVSVVSDATGGRFYTTEPTPGAANSAYLFSNVTGSPMDNTDPVRIHEVLRKNKYSLIDADGERNPWVELYNAGGTTVSLKGYYLSDSEDDLFRWALPDVSIPAGGYLVVFLSGKNRTEGELHTDFRLGKDETALYFTFINTMRSDVMELPETLGDNISAGRASDGSIEYYAQPTPGTENAKGFETADALGFFNMESVYISEVSSVQEAKSKENDWVELYNGDTESVDLSGWGLSDDIDEPSQWTFADGTVLEPGRRLVVETTGNPVRQKKGAAPFGLSGTGETVFLTNASGLIEDVFETGVLEYGITAGRVEGDPSGKRVYFQKATKGKQNSEQYAAGRSAQPVFSETGLYQNAPVLVYITCTDPDAAIYYTLDGSEPSVKSNLYTGAVNVSGNTVLRAASVKEGLLKSEITSCTYVFDEPHAIPVVTVTLKPSDFETVSSATKTNKPERKAEISYYETDGSLGVTFACGLAVKGQGTITYRQKSFSLNLRGAYGQSSVTYPFFDDLEFKTFSALVLRNSGQDVDEARMRDSLFSRIVRGMNLDYAATRPVAVYINGRYWGLYDFNEKLNTRYLETHYGVDSDEVDFIQRNETQLKGKNDGYLEARAWGQSSKPKDDEKFAQYAEMIDVDFCTDYIIAQTFIINSDMFNQKFWHSQDGKIRWRPVFYDLDWGLNEDSSVKRSLFPSYFSVEGIPSRNGSLTNLDVFVGLKKNAAWRQMFIERYVELCSTLLSPENTLKVFDELYEEYKTEMPRHIDRWGFHKNMKDWQGHVDILRKKLSQRTDYALDNLKEYFKISDAEMAELKAKYRA